MYTLTRGPAKLATKAGVRGSSQQIEHFESRREALGTLNMSSPKPVFNGKRLTNSGNPRGQSMMGNQAVQQQDPITPQHEENVRFLRDAWLRVEQDLHASQRRDGLGSVYYIEKDPVSNKDFEAIDLDQWFANRLLEKIKSNS